MKVLILKFSQAILHKMNFILLQSVCNSSKPIMSSPGQRRGICGHIMAGFDKHACCARCRDKLKGDDPCVSKKPCSFCDVLTPVQKLQISTPSYQTMKEK